MKDIISKFNQICSFLRILSHLLKTSLMENVFFLYADIASIHLYKKHHFLKLLQVSSWYNFTNITSHLEFKA